jgi:hypothetical protein
MLGDTQWLWLIALVGGPLILGILLARGVRQTEDRRRDDPAGVARTEQATHDLYEEEEHRGERPHEQQPPIDLEEARRREEVARMRSAGGRRL